MTICHIYDILLSREKIWNTKNPIDKGKPFERMGHKALEPKGPEGLMVVSYQKDNIKGFKASSFFEGKMSFFYCFACALKGHKCFSGGEYD